MRCLFSVYRWRTADCQEDISKHVSIVGCHSVSCSNCAREINFVYFILYFVLCVCVLFFISFFLLFHAFVVYLIIHIKWSEMFCTDRKATRATSVTAATSVSKARKVSMENVETRVHLEQRDREVCRELSEKSDFLDFRWVLGCLPHRSVMWWVDFIVFLIKKTYLI